MLFVEVHFVLLYVKFRATDPERFESFRLSYRAQLRILRLRLRKKI